MARRRPRSPRFALRLLHSSSTWGPPSSSRLRRSSRGRISPPAGTSRSKFWRIWSPHHHRSHHSTASRSGDPIDSVVQSTFYSVQLPYNSRAQRCVSPKRTSFIRTECNCPQPPQSRSKSRKCDEGFTKILRDTKGAFQNLEMFQSLPSRSLITLLQGNQRSLRSFARQRAKGRT